MTIRVLPRKGVAEGATLPAEAAAFREALSASLRALGVAPAEMDAEQLAEHVDKALAGERRCFDLPCGPQRACLFIALMPYRDATGCSVGLMMSSSSMPLDASLPTSTGDLAGKPASATGGATTAEEPPVRDRFLSVVSHELRSPLAGIQSWTHVLERLLKQDANDDTRHTLMARALSGIAKGVERQTRAIDSLIDATRVMSGKIPLQRKPVRLNEVLAAAVTPYLAQARDKGVTLQMAAVQAGTDATPDATPDAALPLVSVDAARLQDVFSQLISNAVRFTPAGGSVTVLCGVDHSKHQVFIRISDTGRGFAADFLPQVFEPFRQADDSYTRLNDGFGLSLAVARQVVLLLGGGIEAASDGEGRGASFTVTFPWIAAMPVASPAAQASLDSAPSSAAAQPVRSHAALSGRNATAYPSLVGLSVMVIDDQLEARESLAAMLEQSGAEVVPAGSGPEALAALEARGPRREPDVLICDLAMPGEDGYATLKRIREWESLRGILPGSRLSAIAVTAFALSEDRLRALSKGFLMHFAKPVDPLRLLGAVAALGAR
ncbi:MAG: hybrid sensor histidine kinase/response regulator [Janthinobacterium lividum]